MSAPRQPKCPGCGSTDLKVVKVLNPDTRSLNADCTLECEACKHQWKGRTASRYYLEGRAKGKFI
jgi:hypothetical protein